MVRFSALETEMTDCASSWLPPADDSNLAIRLVYAGCFRTDASFLDLEPGIKGITLQLSHFLQCIYILRNIGTRVPGSNEC